MSKVLSSTLRACDHYAEQRHASRAQSLARWSEEADASATERTVKPTKQDEKGRAAAAIFSERDRTFDVSRWQLEIMVTPSEAQKAAPVTVTNTPLPVNIANSPTVRDADNPARQVPIIGEGTTSGAANQTGCSDPGVGSCTIGLFQVPTGKRLVLEYVSMNACMHPGQVATVLISVSSSSPTCAVGTSCPVQRVYYLTQSPPAVASDVSSLCPAQGSAMTSVAQSVRIYANAGQIIVAGALLNTPDTGGANYVFGLSGYLVDAQ